MIELVRVAYEVQRTLELNQLPFTFIGGVALQSRRQPRVTDDVDLTVFTDFGGEDAVIALLLSTYTARVPNASEFAKISRVLLLQSETGVGIDVAMGAFPYEKLAIARSTLFEYAPGISLRTCSAEDLVVLKAFANRDQDWADIRGILVRQKEILDWEYVCEHLTPLVELKEELEILSRLEKLRQELR